MIKAIIFDLDNTLYNEGTYFLEVFKVFVKKHNIDFSEIETIFSNKSILISNDIFGDILKELGIHTPRLQEELFKLYKTIDTKLQLYEDARELITFAKERGLKLGIITNGVIEAQRNKIRCLSIQNLFDSIVYAREFGKLGEKPNVMPYRKILRELKIKPKEAIYIGDNLETDIEGARELTIKTIWLRRGYFKDYSFIESDYTVSSLKDVIEKLNILGEA